MNSDGSLDTDFIPGAGANGTVTNMIVQSDGKIIISGGFTQYASKSRVRIARVNANGTLDTGFTPGSSASDGGISAIALQTDNKILIGGAFTTFNGTSINRIARLNSDGTLDNSFDPAAGPNNTIRSMALQDDGKIIIGGEFVSYNATTKIRLARVNSDGSIDNSFDPGFGASNTINTISLQTDGKLIIGGNFNSYNDIGRIRVARINTNGSFDAAFNPGTGSNNIVRSIAHQADGKILIGGDFTSYNGTLISRLARLNTNGSLHNNFTTGSGANGFVQSIFVQPDGKILIAGLFSLYNNTSRNCIARLNADGTLDNTFNPGLGANNTIWHVARQDDGKIVIVGEFDSFDGTSRSRIARLNADGSLDNSFNPGLGADNSIGVLALQSDGKIIIGGAFESYNGTARFRIARVNTDGSLDNSFDTGTGTDGLISSIRIQNDGKIIIGGEFLTYNSVANNRIVRLNTNGSQDISFNVGTGANNIIGSIAIQSNGRIIVAGAFDSFNGSPKVRIVRLLSNGSIDTNFDPGSGANNNIWCMALAGDEQIVIGGSFTAYDGTGKNRIARVLNPCPMVFGTDNITSCAPITWIDGNIYFTNNNTATHILAGASQNGCDSLVTLNLTMQPCNQLQPGDCGAMNITMETVLRAVNLNAAAYSFKVTGPNNGGLGWNGNTYIYNSPNRGFKFANVPGSYWGQTYSVEVALGDGLGNFGPYGNACNVSLINLIPTTTLEALYCNQSVAHDVNLFAIPVNGALNYRFRLNGTQEITKTQRKVKMNEFTGIVWGQTYSMDIAIQDADGNWGAYGSACNVTVAPTTQIQASQCNLVNVLSSTVVQADGVSGSIGYRFKITGANNGGPGWVGNEFILNRPNRTMTFGMVPGVLQGQQYSVQVAVTEDGVLFMPYGNVCNLTLSSMFLAINDNEIYASDKTMLANTFEVNASQNPFSLDFGIQVMNANDFESININIYDMSGKLIERHTVNALDIENSNFGSSLASGMYMIEVKQGTNQAVIRQVKN